MLRAQLDRLIETESEGWPLPDEPRAIAREPGDVLSSIEGSIDELNALTPASDGQPLAVSFDDDLAGHVQAEVVLSLDGAVLTAVEQNLGIQVARLQPAINEQDVIAAEAAFDWVMFASGRLDKTDQPTTTPVLSGIPLGIGLRANESARFETGVRRALSSGGLFTASSDLTRSQDNTPGDFSLSPDPAYLAAIRLGLEQPLLRGFGEDVNRATIALNRNQTERSAEQLRTDLLQLVADTEAAYWDLVFAWRDTMIREWLVEVGSGVRDSIRDRMELDARSSEYATAVATVEQRKSEVIRARRSLRAASDRLKVLMNDPAVTIGSEVILKPTDDTIDEPITFALSDAMRTAIALRPEVRQAALAIDDSRIRQALADNATLPELALTAQLAYFGLDDTASGSYAELGESRFIDYVVGLAFELPMGNRAAEAGALRARFERTSAVLGYRKAVQNIVLEVKSALRDVLANYQLIEATRSNRLAQAENLRVFIARQPVTGLDPSILDLWLRYQQSVGQARLDELQSLVNYRKSIAELHRSMGTALDARGIDMQIVETDPFDPRPTSGLIELGRPALDGP